MLSISAELILGKNMITCFIMTTLSCFHEMVILLSWQCYHNMMIRISCSHIFMIPLSCYYDNIIHHVIRMTCYHIFFLWKHTGYNPFPLPLSLQKYFFSLFTQNILNLLLISLLFMLHELFVVLFLNTFYFIFFALTTSIFSTDVQCYQYNCVHEVCTQLHIRYHSSNRVSKILNNCNQWS
jgi:hypothetical protein